MYFYLPSFAKVRLCGWYHLLMYLMGLYSFFSVDIMFSGKCCSTIYIMYFFRLCHNNFTTVFANIAQCCYERKNYFSLDVGYEPFLVLWSNLRFYLPLQVNSDGQPRKKKRPKSFGREAVFVALGTSAGEVYLYNHATASVETQLVGGHSQTSVNDLTWAPGTNLFSCANDGYIAEWSLSDFKVKRYWIFYLFCCISAW